MEFLVHWFGPLHPPLVHFAVVCPILAFFALLTRKIWPKPWLLEAAAALWVLSLASALAAGITGHLFSLYLGMETEFSLIPPETAMRGQLRDHALYATVSIVVAILAFWAALSIFKGKPWPSKALLPLGFVMAALFSLTGHEGGEMVYGPQEAPASSSTPTALSTAPGNTDLFSLIQDYRQNLVKVNDRMWNSRTHGHRWVNTYVSKEALEAYKNSNEIPEGALVVKESFEDQSGQASQTPGPLYVMRKGKLSDSPQTGGWQYALRWDKPVAGNPEGIQAPVTWLPDDANLNSCMKCHRHFKDNDYMGGVPSAGMNP